MNKQLRLLAIQIQLKDMDAVELTARIDELLPKKASSFIETIQHRLDCLIKLDQQLNKNGATYPEVEFLFYTTLTGYAKLTQVPTSTHTYIPPDKPNRDIHLKVTYGHTTYTSTTTPYITTDSTA